MDKNEEVLILRAQQGNLHAFEKLVHRYDAKVYSIILSMMQNSEDARDIYQEVFIKVYKSIGKFRFESEFSTWLHRIAVNSAITFRGKKNSKQHYYQEGNSYEQELEARPNTNTPEKELLNAELNEQIQMGIEMLPPQQKAVFVLRHYHGYKLGEIARIMECSDGTIKNYLFRATQKMRETLRPYYR